MPTNQNDTASGTRGLVTCGANICAVVAAMSKVRISEALEQFAEQFIFLDHGLDLEIRDKQRLAEFLHARNERFSDVSLEIVSTIDHTSFAVVEWRLAATVIESYGLSRQHRFPIVFRGATIASVDEGRITQWSDYYDRTTAYRHGLDDRFKGWLEY